MIATLMICAQIWHYVGKDRGVSLIHTAHAAAAVAAATYRRVAGGVFRPGAQEAGRHQFLDRRLGIRPTAGDACTVTEFAPRTQFFGHLVLHFDYGAVGRAVIFIGWHGFSPRDLSTRSLLVC